jgi:hypothetical protein
MKNMAKNELTSLLCRNEVVTPSTLTLNQLADELTSFKHNNQWLASRNVYGCMQFKGDFL